MLPISQIFLELTWKPYQIFWETEIYHHNFKISKLCVYNWLYRSLYRRPINLNGKAQTFSNHKSRNIIKYLVGLTLSGAVSSLFAGRAGRASHKEITRLCWFCSSWWKVFDWGRISNMRASHQNISMYSRKDTNAWKKMLKCLDRLHMFKYM